MKDNRDGTISDEATGLMWQQKISERMTWDEAVSYCERLNLAGHNDWRLPTLNELKRIADYSRYGPVIHTSYFPNIAASFYWSSTTYTSLAYDAWYVYFNYGNDSDYTKYSDCCVRAVRGGVHEK